MKKLKRRIAAWLLGDNYKYELLRIINKLNYLNSILDIEIMYMDLRDDKERRNGQLRILRRQIQSIKNIYNSLY